MTTIATVIADLQTALADAQSAGAATVVEALNVALTDALVTMSPPTPFKMTLNLSAIVCLSAQYAGDRYERFERMFYLAPGFSDPGGLWSMTAAGVFTIQISTFDEAAGGTKRAFTYPQYGLLFNGVERARFTPTAGSNVGHFTGSLVDEADGPVLTQIVAYDATGTLVAAPTESMLSFWAIVDRTGAAKDVDYVIAQTVSHEWVHDPIPQYGWVKIPKAALGNTVAPLVYTAAVPFSTTLPKSQITRIPYVPCGGGNQSQQHYPVTSIHGPMTTSDIQGYFKTDISRLDRRLPMLDGPRGIATSGQQTFLRVGRDGKVYGLDSHSFWVMDGTGAKRTLAGIRFSQAQMWGEQTTNMPPFQLHPFAEVVGNWDASIPELERFPWESWGMAWDERTLGCDPTAPIPPGETEHPHTGTGPVAYVTDRHGYVLRMEFSPISHATPAVITRLCALDDPWGIAFDPSNNQLYVAERRKHRIVKIDADTGAYLGDVIANAAGATFVAFDDEAYAVSVANAAPGVTLDQARAQNILAPELLELQDGFVYYGSSVSRDIRRVNLATGVVEICARPAWDTKSIFNYIALSDGTFGPRGTIFSTTFSNIHFGRPQAFLPGAGVATDGVTLTHEKEWAWQGYGRNLINGNGTNGWEDTNYGEACAVGNGMLAVGSASMALDVFRQSTASETPSDMARLASGATYWRDHLYHLIWSNYGYGSTTYPLPWGENADVDYWLTANGHVKPR